MSRNLKNVSVIMPTYNQGAFISRAIASLQLQTHKDWELIIVNDGSTDYTREVIEYYLKDPRIKLIETKQNTGLGKSVNKGLDLANYDLIAYLPSDDLLYSNHLEELAKTIQNNKDAALVYSGAKYNYTDGHTRSSNDVTLGRIGKSLQMVQVLHSKSEERWMEREELVTDDLNKMFWKKLSLSGEFVPTGKITCEWINHPNQRHKMIRETLGGGIYTYKQFYNVNQLIRYQSTEGSYLDESEDYRVFREKPVVASENGLKILLVGELCFNPERILAFEEQGHKLYGLWMPFPDFYNTTGPLPFGHVEDIPNDNCMEKIKEIKPDIIYAMMNHQVVSFAHDVLLNNPGIPFVWHFKESPFFCRQKGTWKELVELYLQSDGQIYINPEIKAWFNQFISEEDELAFVLDGDLPKNDWFTSDRQPLLSDSIGGIHTVVPGRPFGLYPRNIKDLAEQNIHLHMYGNFYSTIYDEWIQTSNEQAPGYLHIHPTCAPKDWVKELSQYDAGWLHYFKSENGGELMKAVWNDLNYPARMATLACAGLPMLQHNNTGHIVATQSLIKKLGMGIYFESFEDLGKQMRNKEFLNEVRENVWNKRMNFSFDHHVNDLVDFFRKVISRKQAEKMTNLKVSGEEHKSEKELI